MKVFLTFLFISLFGISGKVDSEKVFAITNVTVISTTSDAVVIPNVSVIIANKRIQSIGGTVPGDAINVDGRGKFLIPGLIDMHVHVPTDIRFGAKLPTQPATVFFNTQDVMTPYVANGVTTVIELNARPEHFAQRNEVAKGTVVGPRMALAALINGVGSGRIASTPADGRQAVRDAKAEGYEFIKLYSALNVETYKAIIDEAQKQGLKTVGHIPNAFRGMPDQAFVPGFGMVAHAEEFSKLASAFSEDEAKRYAQIAKNNGTWLSPTLIAMKWILSQARSLDELHKAPSLKYVHPLLQSKWLTANNYNRNSNADRVRYFEKMVVFHNKLVNSFKAAGVPLVAGTDAGVSGIVGGFSLHDELALLVEAGLTPNEALASATQLPAEWLGLSQELGTIETGKLADLILLEANPLTDIANTRKITGVVVDGRWMTSSELQSMLADLARRNEADKPKYDWKIITGRKN